MQKSGKVKLQNKKKLIGSNLKKGVYYNEKHI